MRNYTKFIHYGSALKSISASFMRSKHSWMVYLAKNNISHCSQNYGALLPLQSSRVSIEQCDRFHRFQNIKMFSTTIALAKGKDRGKEKKKGTQMQHIDYRELGEVVNVEKLTTQFDGALNTLKDNFIKNTSLRTSVGTIEELPVTFEGDQYILQELVTITRTPKLVRLDTSSFPQITKSILDVLRKHQMNLNPQQDGTMIYIPIPQVTKEYRESLTKTAKAYFVKFKTDIRDVRNQQIKKIQNIEKLPQDTSHRVQGYIDILVHQYTKKAEEMLEKKQQELIGS